MFKLNIKTLGMTALSRGLNRFAQEVKDWTPAYQEIWGLYRGMVRKNFQVQGVHVEWPALSPGYARWKEMHHPGKPILVLTGKMKKSFVSNATGTTSGTIMRINKLNAEFGSSDRKAEWHQHGTPRMPARPPLEFAERDIDRWTRVLHEYAYKLAMGLL